MRFILGLVLLLLLLGRAQAQVPGLTEVSGFVCHTLLAGEKLGTAYQLGGPDLVSGVAADLMSKKECGNLTETKWGIQRQVRTYSYHNKVVVLLEFDIDGVQYWGLHATDILET